jgi:zinc finger SWIM domain-containing protein 3
MFPELLFVDAMYKLLDLRLPVYLLLCVDGDGLSEIVGMFILAEETKEVIEEAVQLFQKFNSNWEDTQVIMSDKDFTEWDAFAKCFPGASLNICLFHTLR